VEPGKLTCKEEMLQGFENNKLNRITKKQLNGADSSFRTP
jgi:hypothetical protein